MDDACFDLDFGNRRCSDENILDSGTKMVVNIFVYYHGMVGSHCFRSIAESSFLGWGGAASGRRSGLYSWRYYIWIEKTESAIGWIWIPRNFPYICDDRQCMPYSIYVFIRSLITIIILCK